MNEMADPKVVVVHSKNLGTGEMFNTRAILDASKIAFISEMPAMNGVAVSQVPGQLPGSVEQIYATVPAHVCALTVVGTQLNIFNIVSHNFQEVAKWLGVEVEQGTPESQSGTRINS